VTVRRVNYIPRNRRRYCPKGQSGAPNTEGAHIADAGAVMSPRVKVCVSDSQTSDLGAAHLIAVDL
jgi:hypothetical protein